MYVNAKAELVTLAGSGTRVSESEGGHIHVVKESEDSTVTLHDHMGSVTIRHIYKGNLFVINTIFTWNVATTKQEFFIWLYTYFADTKRINTPTCKTQKLR